MKRTRPLMISLAAAAVAVLVGFVMLGIESGASAVTSDATTAFNPNLLMSDAVFDNATSMSTADIQAFLNRFPNSCLKNYQAPLPIDYSTVGSNVSAAQVISASAAMYAVNPQVILTTLEKEQSLVTGGGGCAPWRYWSAMGYACPDGGALYNYPSLGITGTCVSAQQHAGFTAQVNHGTWQLQFNRQRAVGNLGWRGNQSTPNYGFYTKGTYSQYAGAPPVYYDGYATIDGQAVYMTNGVTATLYTYTPHLSGNQLFVNLFTNWFGSTIGASATSTSTTTSPPSTSVSPPVTIDPVATGNYVDNVYRLFLGRPASTAEKAWWLSYLQSGRSIGDLVTTVTGSNEALDYQVVVDYVIMLHRAPEPGGVGAWSAYLALNHRNDAVLAQLAASAEYFENRSSGDTATFVTNLYQDLLGRNADAAGLAYWSGMLNSGKATRLTAANSFVQTAEFARTTVAQSFRKVLGRTADTAGLNYWTVVYLSHHDLAAIQGALASGSEGKSYLSTLQ